MSHLTAAQYVDLHFVSQQLFDDYFKFAIVRHPVDRLYSTYKYRKFSDYLSFDSFVRGKLESLMCSKTEGFFYKPSYEYIYNNKGEQLVDFVGKLENLKEGFSHVQDKLNTNLRLNHYNKSKKQKSDTLRKFKILYRILRDEQSWSYVDFQNKNKKLSEKAMLIIKDKYAKDFEVFGYNLIK